MPASRSEDAVLTRWFEIAEGRVPEQLHQGLAGLHEGKEPAEFLIAQLETLRRGERPERVDRHVAHRAQDSGSRAR
jgi:hypothetical protein